MADQTIYMYRQIIDYADFTAYYLSSLRANSIWYIDAAPDWLPAYNNSEFLVYDNQISFVTSGSLKAENNNHEEKIHVEGSPINISRSKSIYKCTSLEDNTTAISLYPKKNIIYNRELYKFETGQSFTFPLNQKETYFFVAKGVVSINGNERGPFHMLKFSAGETLNLTCSDASYVIRIWE